MKLSGEVRPPGDKSISHRALIFAGLARGTSRIRGLNPGHDVASTRRILERLGVEVRDGDGVIEVDGRAGVLGAPAGALDCGNSGTTMRLLMGVLAAQAFSSTLIGDASLSARPMERVAVPLRAMGAGVSTSDGRPPVEIEGKRRLRGIAFQSPVASAQVKSAVLLAGLFADGETRVLERPRSRDHTERMLRAMGANLVQEGASVVLRRGDVLEPLDVTVPGDPSAAAFHAAAAALVPGSSLRLTGVSVNPTRFGFFTVLERMGALVLVENRRDEGGEPVADLVVSADALRGTDVGPEEIPSMVDEVPVLAVVAACAEGPTRITGAAELRVKETDRLSAVTRALVTLGASVRETEDGLELDGGGLTSGGTVDAEGDHRMAMSLAVAALVAPAPVEVSGVEVAAVSDPDFLPTLARVTRS